MSNKLKVDISTIRLKVKTFYVLKLIKYQSENRRHLVDRATGFDHVDKLEALDICISNMTQ